MVMNPVIKAERKYCYKTSDIPKCDHWAILYDRSVTSNGGHGYGQMTDHYCEYVAYLDKNLWMKDIAEAMNSPYGKKEFIAIHVTPATVQVNIQVNDGKTTPRGTA